MFAKQPHNQREKFVKTLFYSNSENICLDIYYNFLNCLVVFVLVSLTPVVHLDLRISPRIFEKIRNDPNVIIRGLVEGD
jgi:hypothetical protein